jgi:hypothetical protein
MRYRRRRGSISAGISSVPVVVTATTAARFTTTGAAITGRVRSNGGSDGYDS